VSGLLEAIAGAEARAGADANVARELESIRGRFEEAAAALSRNRIEALPWYMFIGAPGSGKTTALLNSGLKFLLPSSSSGIPVAGVGGTRNCDWWFTEEAVLLDTAGRYTTQDSHSKADAAAWHGFLGLLQEFRPAQPLNGAFVTASLSDLMLWTKLERAKFTAHVRMRLAELYAALGARFPVYLLVTKVDLLAGFLEFFGDFDPERRGQVWGTTFEMEVDSVTLESRYAKEFEPLEARLNAEMLAHLHEERDLQRRAAIYRFPQQFHPVGPLVGEFIGQTFTAQVEHKAPLLRGIYYTSGTQQGNPIDRVLGTLTRTFGLERGKTTDRGNTGRSYFISRLLREVVLREAGLTAPL
jgi:type VI secretion system protein ImpL